MARRSLFVDTTPLRESPAFARLWAGGALTGIGNQMTIVVVGLEIYALTSSTLSVAMVGVFAVVPMVVFGLYGGMLADAFDRRKVALVAAVGAWLSTAIIALHAWWGMESVGLLYLLTAVNSVASTLMSSTRFAIIPRLVPPAHLPAAAALSGISTGIMVTVGPALAGVLVALVGFPITYTIDVVLFLGAFLGIVTLPAIRPEGEVHPPGLQSLKSGWRFLKSAPNIRMQFLLDIIAMTFGQPRVLFPAVGALVLGGGAVTVGVLTAAGAVGALGSSVLSGRLGGVRWQGKAIGRAIQGYGACMAGFGLVLLASVLGLFGPVPADGSASVVAILAAALMLALAGACDEISAIFRSTMMQSAVPDAMRGRLQGLFIVVVTGGPRLGDLYVGLLASITMLWFPPLLGGVLIVLVVTVLVRVQGTLRLYDAKNPVP